MFFISLLSFYGEVLPPIVDFALLWDKGSEHKKKKRGMEQGMEIWEVERRIIVQLGRRC